MILYLALLVAIPARLVVPGLGAAGRPSVILGLGMLFWWCVIHLVPHLTPRNRQPLRAGLAILVAVLLMSYALGVDRGLLPAEHRSAARYLIGLLSWVGLTLVVADGVRGRASREKILTWMTGLATFSALLGALQFYGLDLAPSIRVPGLVYNADLVGIRVRGGPGFNRVYGTMQHYIEFGVVLGMILPLAVHQALVEVRRGVRRLRWFCVAAMASAVPFSISRAGFLALSIGFIVLSTVWPRRFRWRAYLVAIVCLGVFRIFVPGVLGTIRSAFLNYDNDPSIQNRTADYGAVSSYISDRPWFGRGPGTFTPELYRVLDNQYLGMLLEAGTVGTACFAGLLVLAYVLARQVRRWSDHEAEGHLAQALAAAVLVAAVTSFTFDSLAFPTFAGMLFLLVGLIGSVWADNRHSYGAGTAPVRGDLLAAAWMTPRL